MPEVHFRVLWPDGVVEQCYSPSSVIAEYISPGTEYTVADFMNRTRSALAQASKRVEQIYGHPCSLAQAQASAIENRYAAGSFADTNIVTCLEMSPTPRKGAKK
ncbi:MAG: MSMEG_0570 family nitrogen starvation response protein [Paracoccaceae bacterium]